MIVVCLLVGLLDNNKNMYGAVVAEMDNVSLN